MSGLSPRPYPWWEFFIPGVILLVGSIYVWWFLDNLHGMADVDQLPSVIDFLYNLAGKWGFTLFVAAIGTLLTARGAYKLLTKHKERSSDLPKITP